jgi:hypothetical protein
MYTNLVWNEMQVDTPLERGLLLLALLQKPAQVQTQEAYKLATHLPLEAELRPYSNGTGANHFLTNNRYKAIEWCCC